jgi:2-dehydro-3-deoxyphosphogluconate aldolase/(4S)-4-hydroxy-2-oxoglutarate aldolase
VTVAETLGKILYRGFVPIIVGDDLPPLRCIEQLVAVGLEAVEISSRRPEAARFIAEAKAQFPQLAVGAATLLEEGRMRDFVNGTGHYVPTIAEAVDAGADFIVSLLPFREPTYARFAGQVGIVAGVKTPGEAAQALDWGANMVKFVTPHLVGGPEFFTAMDPATYRCFPYFVTGGMKYGVLPGYVAAGVLAFGAGFDLILGADYRSCQAAFDADRVREGLNDYLRTLDRARRQYQEHIPFASRDAAAIARASGRCLNI